MSYSRDTNTYADCLTSPIDGTFLVSTKEKLAISEENGNRKNELFRDEKTSVCQDVCLVSNDKKRSFVCNSQVFETHLLRHTQEKVKHVVIDTDIDLSVLRKQDQKIDQYDKLMNKYLSQKQLPSFHLLSRITTILSIVWWTSLAIYMLGRCIFKHRCLEKLQRRRKKRLPNPLYEN